jgi:hypothetical protein
MEMLLTSRLVLGTHIMLLFVVMYRGVKAALLPIITSALDVINRLHL